MYTDTKQSPFPMHFSKESDHVFDTRMAVMLCLVISLAFGLGYTIGKNPIIHSTQSTTAMTGQRKQTTYGRFGHMPSISLNATAQH